MLSLDDVYLTRAERLDLAQRIHPLLAVRGPPGTHDVGLALKVIDDLLAGRLVIIPSFDKGRDDRVAPGGLPKTKGPTDIVILKGWCVGARPQAAGELQAPVDAREAKEDPDAVWRTYVNKALAGPYQSLFGRIALQVLILAPNSDVVPRWRQEQEHALRRRSPAAQTLSDEEVAHFVQLYQRLTDHIAREVPRRADVVIRLDEDRVPVKVEGLAPSTS